ncbi:MAG: transposase [Alkalinema sp. CAN_BIN05]|nr:transposase [Alkalinema sp. CAN_BIN05]
MLCDCNGILTLQGTETVEQGQPRRVDPHWQRGASYLKIGWAWVKSALAKGWEFWVRLTLSTQVDPDRAYASKWQVEEKRERLEFTVRFAS